MGNVLAVVEFSFLIFTAPKKDFNGVRTAFHNYVSAIQMASFVVLIVCFKKPDIFPLIVHLIGPLVRATTIIKVKISFRT